MTETPFYRNYYSQIAKTTSLSLNSPDSNLFYEQDRWAKLRALNVEDIGSLWKEKPERVKVITDPRLGEEQLVIMSKNIFERMVNMLSDIEAGNIGVSTNIEVISQQLTLIEKLIEQQNKKELEPVEMAISVMSKIISTTKTQFFLASDTASLKPSRLTEEEKKLLDYEE
jgi:ribosomal protein S20